VADGQRISPEAISEQLEQELLRIHVESYGKGAREAKVYVHEDTVFCILDGLELLPNEEFMINAGRGDAVIDIRLRFQQAIETTFRAAVERATGRSVISFASITKLDPNYVCEVFRLGDEKESIMPEVG
jgi:uncharacterized protein YbcI